jgi:hypothetical protein
MKFMDKYFDLPKWNKEQKKLWQALVEMNLVEENDYDTFAKFSEFFESKVIIAEMPPTLSETIEWIKHL